MQRFRYMLCKKKEKVKSKRHVKEEEEERNERI